jgi:hypothetical protein
MRDPRVTTRERDEAAIVEACELLRPLTNPARSRSVVNWDDPDASNDPRDVFEAAVEFVIALLDPATPTNDTPAETYIRSLDEPNVVERGTDRAQYLADELLGAQALIVRSAVLPALRLGRLPKRKGPRHAGNLLRDRWIAAVVETICQRHGLDPYRNPLSEHRCNGFAVVAAALKRLGIRLAETSVAAIYERHRQA